jgi:hypothetical protein
MGAEKWTSPDRTDYNYRTMTIVELERLWTSNRNRLEGVLAAGELMRRYSCGDISINKVERNDAGI